MKKTPFKAQSGNGFQPIKVCTLSRNWKYWKFQVTLSMRLILTMVVNEGMVSVDEAASKSDW